MQDKFNDQYITLANDKKIYGLKTGVEHIAIAISSPKHLVYHHPDAVDQKLKLATRALALIDKKNFWKQNFHN